MASGTPAVTSNRASLPEVVGAAGPTFEADDVEGMAGAIESLLYKPEYRQAQVQRGLRQAEKFNWQNTATKISSIYSTCLEGR